MASFGQNFARLFKAALQEYFPTVNVGIAIAQTNFDSSIKTHGQSVDFPRFDYDAIQVLPITRNVASSNQVFTGARETLTIQYEEGIQLLIAHGDLKQGSDLNFQKEFTEAIIKKVATRMDVTILGEILNAATTFDNGTLTTLTPSGVPVAITAANIPDVVFRSSALLRLATRGGVVGTGYCLIVDPMVFSKMQTNIATRNADYSIQYLIDGIRANRELKPAGTGSDGFSGFSINGFPIFISTNLPSTLTLALPTQPTAGDTITINGVVITFVSSLTAVNQVLIAGTVDLTRTNLAAFFNDQTIATGPVATAGHTALNNVSAGFNLPTDFQTITNMYPVAVNNNTADTLTISTLGGYVSLAETMAGAGNLWASNVLHMSLMRKGSICVAIQSDMETFFVDKATGYFSAELSVRGMWGTKTFYEGARQMVKINVDATAL